jgi:hypothetical protein
MGDIAFQNEDFLAFAVVIVGVSQADLTMVVGGEVRCRCGFGPGQHGVEGTLLEADVLLAKELAQAQRASSEDSLGTAELSNQGKGDIAVPEVVEAGGVARQSGIEVFADLASECRRFPYQIAAVADGQLQFAPVRGRCCFD